jgi:hypothetical protein
MQGSREPATVVARWQDWRALLRTASGETLQVEVAPELQAEVDVGAAAWVERSADGQVLAWALVDGTSAPGT